MTDEERTAADLEAAIADELVSLWHDLDNARRRAYDGSWSMDCDQIKDRIHTLTELVGPTPWVEVPITLLESGIYQGIYAEAGITVEVDSKQVAEVRRAINAQIGGSL